MDAAVVLGPTLPPPTITPEVKAKRALGFKSTSHNVSHHKVGTRPNLLDALTVPFPELQGGPYSRHLKKIGLVVS